MSTAPTAFNVDYLIVGSGLTGSVMARLLTDMGFKVMIVERRSHVGGNVHDYTDKHGVRIHTYGPHYFRTSSEKIWEFVNRFSSFYRYEASLMSMVDGSFERWPVVQSYIKKTVGEDWKPSFHGVPSNFEEASLAMMPQPVYEKFVKPYTEKQWGVEATKLDAGLASRFSVRMDDEIRLKTHQYQGIPTHGYATFMQEMLKGIPILMNFDYLQLKESIQVQGLTVYTGAIDEYFDFEMGKLTYRGQIREHEYIADKNQILPCGQVNYPARDHGPHVRVLEWKHMMEPQQAALIKGTVITKETPFTPTVTDQYEYPFPDDANKLLYNRYRERADTVPGLLVCGRLGEYKYFDMDQAIARAQVLVKRILAQRQLPEFERLVAVTSRTLDAIGGESGEQPSAGA